MRIIDSRLAGLFFVMTLLSLLFGYGLLHDMDSKDGVMLYSSTFGEGDFNVDLSNYACYEFRLNYRYHWKDRGTVSKNIWLEWAILEEGRVLQGKDKIYFVIGGRKPDHIVYLQGRFAPFFLKDSKSVRFSYRLISPGLSIDRLGFYKSSNYKTSRIAMLVSGLLFFMFVLAELIFGRGRPRKIIFTLILLWSVKSGMDLISNAVSQECGASRYRYI